MRREVGAGNIAIAKMILGGLRRRLRGAFPFLLVPGAEAPG